MMYLKSRIASSSTQLLVAFLVFSLSTGVVGGLLLYMDSIGPDVLTEMSEDTLIDMQVQFRSEFYENNGTDIEPYRLLVQDQDFVESAESISIIAIEDDDVSDERYSLSTVLGVEPSFWNSYSDAVRMATIAGELNSTSCYLQKSMFQELGLEIGSNYTISVPTLDSESNPIRINATLTISGTFESDLFRRRFSLEEPSFSALYVIMDRAASWDYFRNLSHTGTNSIIDRIWTKFSTEDITTGDPAFISGTLSRTERLLEQRILPNASVVEFKLIGIIHEFSAWALSMRTISLAFAIPSIVMGVMLVQYNSNLLADQRRRNVGFLKTRGATGVQAASWVLSMSLFTGLIGSLGAILSGSLAALIAGGTREFMEFQQAQASSFIIVFLPQSILLIFLFTFLLGLAISISTVIKAYLMTPADAHAAVGRDDLTQQENSGNILYQIAAMVVSGVLLTLLINSLTSMTDLSSGATYLGAAMILLLAAFVVSSAFVFAVPLSKLKSTLLTRIGVRNLVAGTRVMGKAGLFAKRSEVMSLVFISMVFTAGIFSSLAATTGSGHMKELFMFEVGGDVVIEVKAGLSNVTLDLLDNITAIEGVTTASGMLRTTAMVEFWMDWHSTYYYYNRTITTYGIEPDTWSKTAYLKPNYAYYTTPDAALEKMRANHTNLITNFQPIIGYDTNILGQSVPLVSDEMVLNLYTEAESHRANCTIVDILADRPSGFGPSSYGAQFFRGVSYLPGEEGDEIFVMVNLDYMHECLNTTRLTKIYIDVEEGADYERILSDISNVAPYSFESVESPYVYIDEVLDSRAGQSIYGAYTLNVIFSVAFLTVGTSLVISMKVRSLRRYFSLMRAIGTQYRTLLAAFIIDSALGVGVGGVVGAIIGSIMTLLVLQMPLTYLGVTTSVTWSRLPMVIIIPMELLTAIVLIAIIASLASTYVIARKGLNVNIADDMRLTD